MAPRIAVTGFDEIVRSDPSRLGDPDRGRRPAGPAPADRGDAAREPERRHLRAHPERGHGLGSARARPPAVPHALHPGRHPRAGRQADRARLPHRPLGDRAAHAGGRAGAGRARRPAVRRLLLGPVRRAHPGHARHDGQPRLPQRRGGGAAAAGPLAPHAAGRARRGHLRQGPARDDDGAGRAARSAVRAGAGRRDPAAHRGRGRGHRAVHRGPLRARRAHAGAGGRPGLPRLRLARAAAASSSAPRPRPRSSARRSGSRCRTPRSRPPGSRSGSTWPGARPAR